MKCTRLLLIVGICGWILLALLDGRMASARPEYKKQFESKYLKPNPTQPNEKELSDNVTAAKCSVCHEAGTMDKKKRNVYGQELQKLLTKDDKGNVKKIQEALDKVEKMHSDPNDDKSSTFGDRMKDGKLPAP